MTAVALDATPQTGARQSSLSRIVHAARLHLANPWTTLYLPAVIFTAVFGMTWVVWKLIDLNTGGAAPREAFTQNTGATWVVFYMTVVAVQAMSLTFRYAMGISLTRREYYVGTALYWVGLSLVYSTGLTILAAIERATGGWGLNGAFFAPAALVDASLGTIWFIWEMLFVGFTFAGMCIATIWVRWQANGLLIFFGAVAVLLIATTWSAIEWGWGATLVSWAADQSLVTLFSLAIPVAAIAGVVGFLFLRKAPARA